MIVLATELPLLRGALLTQGLTGGQWLAAVGLALLLPLVVEISKWVRRRDVRTAGVPVGQVVSAERVVSPERAAVLPAARH
jgi:Ca2+-transporting ATPase